MKERMLVLSLAMALDLVLGDPRWLYHPVRAIGACISWLEKALRRAFSLRPGREEDRGKKYLAGTLLVIGVLLLSTVVPGLLVYLAGRAHSWLGLALEVFWCYQLLALKSLRVESMKVYEALTERGLEEGRKAVSMIVGRDVERLDEKGVIRACVETVAENASDGVVAPFFYMLLFGALGGFFYKAVNTMDSMVGYRNDKYRYLGTAAARLDDVLNFLPSRIAALWMILAAFLLPGFDGRNAWRIFRRDRYKHASPNSAQTESVCAGALGLRLAGDAWYFGELHRKPYIGDARREVETEDIPRANRLLYAVGAFTWLGGMAALLAVSFLT